MKEESALILCFENVNVKCGINTRIKKSIKRREETMRKILLITMLICALSGCGILNVTTNIDNCEDSIISKTVDKQTANIIIQVAAYKVLEKNPMYRQKVLDVLSVAESVLKIKQITFYEFLNILNKEIKNIPPELIVINNKFQSLWVIKNVIPECDIVFLLKIINQIKLNIK